MFPLTKNRCVFWCRFEEFAKHVVLSLFNHGRTSIVVVVGDVLWCGMEFYNSFSCLFTGMTSTDQNQISDLIDKTAKTK